MLDQVSDKIMAVAKDFVFVRCELRDLLLQGSEHNLCRIDVVKNDEQRVHKSKYMFHVSEDSRLYHDARVELRRLTKLYNILLEFGVDKTTDQGLWMPAVADHEQGDTQLNITAAENWVTKSRTAAAIHDDIAANNKEEVRTQLDRYAKQYDHFKICRRSGRSFRVAIRDCDGLRRTCGLNNFCLALGGDIHIVTIDKRHRRKRIDAWRGVTTPLFKYVGREGPTWMVYPDLTP